MQKLVREFVPVADEVYRLQTGSDAECLYFQGIARQGYAGGRAGTSQQGYYVVAPSGLVLGSDNTADPVRLARMLRAALARWRELPRGERRYPGDARADLGGVRRDEDSYPEDGLVLAIHARDLPYAGAPRGDWREGAHNVSYAWFRADEARSLVPPRPRPGAEQVWPAALSGRLARLQLLDFVRGQNMPFQPREVVAARIRSVVTSVAGDSVRLEIDGETRTSTTLAWPFEGDRFTGTVTASRGVGVRLSGEATFDLRTGRFTAFEVAASGIRWGETRAGFRTGDGGPAPIAYALVLAGDEPAARVAPAFFGAYGWR